MKEERVMTDRNDQERRQYLLARFWEAALGFWRKDAGRTAWFLTFAVFTIALVNLGLAYRLNVWHRVMFDALESRDGSGVLFQQSLILFPLSSRRGHGMREYLFEDDPAARVAQLAERARARSVAHQRPLLSAQLVPGDHSKPEYRVAEDLRLSVEAPVDFVLGIFSAVISAITFIGVLWFIGGELEVPIGGTCSVSRGSWSSPRSSTRCWPAARWS